MTIKQQIDEKTGFSFPIGYDTLGDYIGMLEMYLRGARRRKDAARIKQFTNDLREVGK